MYTLTYLQSVILGLLQGVTELFPISSLGHSVLIPALVGGSWKANLTIAGKNSPYLSILVGLHLATSLALLLFFWRDWVRIVKGLFTSIRHRSIVTVDEKLAWLLVIASIPVALAGLVLDQLLRDKIGKPDFAAAFLMVNGLVLLLAERMRRTTSGRHGTAARSRGYARNRAALSADTVVDGWSPASLRTMDRPKQLQETPDDRLARLGFLQGALIGAAQILGLFPGFSRSGATICAGLFRGLDHDDAARFSFLLATPVIGGAALYKVPSLLTPANHAIWGPFAVGCVASFVAAFVSVRFLTKYFETRTMTPFAIYCLVFGAGCLAYFAR